MTELADIFRLHGPEYRRLFNQRMLPSHKRAIRDIEQCRTPPMGGSVFQCPDCGRLRYSYHSCGNRSCPKCQNHLATAWLQKQRSFLLPVPYFLVTATLPASFRPLARANQKTLYSILMREFAAAVKKLSADPRHLAAHVGLIGLLQTWRGDMAYHLHAHFIMPAGGLSTDGKRWIRSKYKDYLLPSKPLAIIFRAKVRDALKKAGLYSQVPASVWKQNWVVDFQPVGNGMAALKYLAPYVFRVAISNKRILSLRDGLVTFLVKDRAANRYRPMSLPAQEFIRRFLQHVLPKGFQKVRYYGFFAPKSRALLERLRQLLGTAPLPPSPSPAPKPIPRCPDCGAQLLLFATLPRSRAPP